MNVFKERRFELLDLTETKLKGNGEVSWCGVNGIIAGVQEMERARKGVAILLNKVWNSAVVDFECVSSKSFGLNSSFQGLKFVWCWGTSPMKDMVKKGIGSGTTWTRLWIA